MDPELIQTILNVLGVNFTPNNQREGKWRAYDAVLPQAGSQHDILYNTVKDGISSALSSFGPTGALLGGLLGQAGAGILVGKAYNKYGLPNSQLAAMPGAVGGARASSAFQQMLVNSADRYLDKTRDEFRDQIRRTYLQDYYKLQHPNDSAANISARVQASMSNPATMPNFLQYIFDPTQIGKQLQAVDKATDSTIRWGQRTDPLGMHNVGAARAVQQTVTQIARQAVNAQDGSYGGFTASAAAQVAADIATSQDVMRSARVNPKNLQQSIQDFKQHVKDITQALSPLRDVFGNDVSSMMGMIKSLTGQSVGQMSAGDVKQIATNISRTTRFSGATPAAIQLATKNIDATLRSFGANSVVRLGALNTATVLTNTIAGGYLPGDMSRAQYQARSQRAIASGQASAGAQNVARMYAIAKNRNNYKGDINQFVDQLIQSGNATQKGMQLAGVTNMNQLGAAEIYSKDFNSARRSGALARVAIAQQSNDLTAQAIMAAQGTLRSAGVNTLSTSQAQNLINLFSKQSNAKLLGQLVSKDGIDLNGTYMIDIGRGRKRAMTRKQLQIMSSARYQGGQQYVTAAANRANSEVVAGNNRQQALMEDAFNSQNYKRSGGIDTLTNLLVSNNGNYRSISSFFQGGAKGAAQNNAVMTILAQKGFGIQASTPEQRDKKIHRAINRTKYRALNPNMTDAQIDKITQAQQNSAKESLKPLQEEAKKTKNTGLSADLKLLQSKPKNTKEAVARQQASMRVAQHVAGQSGFSNVNDIPTGYLSAKDTQAAMQARRTMFVHRYDKDSTQYKQAQNYLAKNLQKVANLSDTEYNARTNQANRGFFNEHKADMDILRSIPQDTTDPQLKAKREAAKQRLIAAFSADKETTLKGQQLYNNLSKRGQQAWRTISSISADTTDQKLKQERQQAVRVLADDIANNSTGQNYRKQRAQLLKKYNIKDSDLAGVQSLLANATQSLLGFGQDDPETRQALERLGGQSGYKYKDAKQKQQDVSKVIGAMVFGDNKKAKAQYLALRQSKNKDIAQGIAKQERQFIRQLGEANTLDPAKRAQVIRNLVGQYARSVKSFQIGQFSFSYIDQAIKAQEKVAQQNKKGNTSLKAKTNFNKANRTQIAELFSGLYASQQSGAKIDWEDKALKQKMQSLGLKQEDYQAFRRQANGTGGKNGMQINLNQILSNVQGLLKMLVDLAQKFLAGYGNANGAMPNGDKK